MWVPGGGANSEEDDNEALKGEEAAGLFLFYLS